MRAQHRTSCLPLARKTVFACAVPLTEVSSAQQVILSPQTRHVNTAHYFCAGLLSFFQQRFIQNPA